MHTCNYSTTYCNSTLASGFLPPCAKFTKNSTLASSGHDFGVKNYAHRTAAGPLAKKTVRGEQNDVGTWSKCGPPAAGASPPDSPGEIRV